MPKIKGLGNVIGVPIYEIEYQQVTSFVSDSQALFVFSNVGYHYDCPKRANLPRPPPPAVSPSLPTWAGEDLPFIRNAIDIGAPFDINESTQSK